ncbi:protein Spindly [Toxorhynchites rutilus septentrionalis]|uniref:protein Spindly n=1 Tax=Toxorhynchites rutilus septentrionalis TaxID=329112 RepID=UPI00247AFF22|nr:protein Spindly [Toxorhynchites rutilus septentrionalis]
MSANCTIIADVRSLSEEELAEQYRRLADMYRALKRSHEDELQASYELRRNYQTASESVTYMSAELESIDSVHKEELSKLKDKYIQTLTTLKESNVDLKQQNVSIEGTVEELQKQLEQLREQMEEQELTKNRPEIATGNVTSSEKEVALEQENEELRTMVTDQQERIGSMMAQLMNAESKLEAMKEEQECLEDNLESKKQELDEMRTTLEATQDENMRLNSLLASLQSAPEDTNRKGNSLFAEVHDQRQQLIDVLESQRVRYNEMKKLYTESSVHIRRLKRENREMCDEIKACSEMFLKADEHFRDETSKELSSMREENQRLRDQLASAEKRLLENVKDTRWVDPFVCFYKNESATFKAQIIRLEMAKRLTDEVCWDAQRDLAKWRFEALKSRYIIANRESLLEENNIPFAQMTINESIAHIDEVALNSAKPNVTCSMGTAATKTDVWNLDLLADLNINHTPVIVSCVKQTTLLLPPPNGPPSVLRRAAKEEVLTPLATPLVTPIQSPKSVKKDELSITEEKKAGPLNYRDIVYIPRNAPLTESLKKKEYIAMVERITKKEENETDDKENVPRQNTDVKQMSQTKTSGWVSEKRTKNNVLIRRFKLPDKKLDSGAQ